jgi:hypothetical protein
MSNENINFQVPPEGFGSYLQDILPTDQAVLAGAFATSMSQVRNITMVDPQKFAQVVFSLETNNGLPLTDGTDVPADQFIVDEALSKLALGTGVYGQYTMSDFFGCMSGLPLPLYDIYTGIRLLQTQKLEKIYEQLYLAVAWEQAIIEVNASYTTTATPDGFGNYNYNYQITGITSVNIANSGGGYGRAGAVAPTGVFTDGSGATVTTTIDTNNNNAPDTFGRITSVSIDGFGGSVYYASGASPTPPDPSINPITIHLQAPPTGTYTYPYTGGTNTAYGTVGWPSMDSVVQALIDDSNNEIFAIQTANDNNFRNAEQLNTLWNILGTTLKVQQRARYTLVPPVPIPHYEFVANYPQNIISFIDTMPAIAAETEPNGSAQTIENTVDLCVVGGQSLIALMREQRNQQRLASLGIPLDNNIDSELTEEQLQLLLANGTLPGATEGVPSPAGDFTIPAWSDNQNCEGDRIYPFPIGYYDPNLQGFQLVTPIFGIPGNRTYVKPGSIIPITRTKYLGPYGDLTGPPVRGPSPYDNTGIIVDINDPATNPDPTTPTDGPGPTVVTDGPQIPVVTVGTVVPVGGGLPYNQGLGSGLPIKLDPETGLPVSPNFPTESLPVDPNLGGGDGTGPAAVPVGQGAGGAGVAFPPINEIPPNLNPIYTASTLLPSTINIPDAIDKVIECNCDCWIN